MIRTSPFILLLGLSLLPGLLRGEGGENFVNQHRWLQERGCKPLTPFEDELILTADRLSQMRRCPDCTGLWVGHHGLRPPGIHPDDAENILQLKGNKKILFGCWTGVGRRTGSEFSGRMTWYESPAQTLSRQDPTSVYIGIAGTADEVERGDRLVFLVRRGEQEMPAHLIGTKWQANQYIGPVSAAELEAEFNGAVAFVNKTQPCTTLATTELKTGCTGGKVLQLARKSTESIKQVGFRCAGTAAWLAVDIAANYRAADCSQAARFFDALEGAPLPSEYGVPGGIFCRSQRIAIAKRTLESMGREISPEQADRDRRRARAWNLSPVHGLVAEACLMPGPSGSACGRGQGMCK